jgi:hypothetical protein
MIAPPAIQRPRLRPAVRRGNGRSGVRIMLSGDSPGIGSLLAGQVWRFQQSVGVSKRRQSGARLP